MIGPLAMRKSRIAFRSKENRMSDTTRRISVPALGLWAPLGLAILRIVTALLFLDHGLMKLLHFRELGLPEMLRAATGLVEMVAGVLIALGLHTRAAALVAAAETAIAYWALDLGDAAILFCTVFFYLVFAGPGAWSLDATIHDRS
jgi:putative oxidoreductase